MYNYDCMDKEERDYLLEILFNKELFPYIKNNYLFIKFRDRIIFKKEVSEFGINDFSDVLDISITDSKYVYYLLDIANDNGVSMNSFDKKKSLRL